MTKRQLMQKLTYSRHKRGNKYGNQKCGKYASEKEAKRAHDLKILQRAGKISNLGEQVSFELIPAQYGECGKDLKGRTVKVLMEKSCHYVADFVYYDNDAGEMVVEDTKGVRTRDYIIKRKLMLQKFGIRIKEI